jgi:uncharacterized coiled-coil protein SlyX
MSRLKSMVGWMVRGGDQTRAELAGQSAAIGEMQQRLADGERLRAEVRGALEDLAERMSSLATRLDHLEARVSDQEAALSSMARVVAPPDGD